MSQDTVVEFRAPGALDDALTELLRNGARQLIQQAVEAELAELLDTNAHRRDDQGRPAVIRNGYLPERGAPGVAEHLGSRSTWGRVLKSSVADGSAVEISTGDRSVQLQVSTRPIWHAKYSGFAKQSGTIRSNHPDRFCPVR